MQVELSLDELEACIAGLPLYCHLVSGTHPSNSLETTQAIADLYYRLRRVYDPLRDEYWRERELARKN